MRRNTLLVATLIGVAACNERAPTAVSQSSPRHHARRRLRNSQNAVAMLGRPLPRLSAAQRQRFDMGAAVFQTNFTPETGLGPLFNAVGCAACHENPVAGGGGNNDPAEGGEDVELHATAFHGAAAPCEDLGAVGGQVIQKQVTPALADILQHHERADPGGLPPTPATAPRLTYSGFGLLDAVPDRSDSGARWTPFDRNGDGISGRPNRTADGRLGRFRPQSAGGDAARVQWRCVRDGDGHHQCRQPDGADSGRSPRCRPASIRCQIPKSPPGNSTPQMRFVRFLAPATAARRSTQ